MLRNLKYFAGVVALCAAFGTGCSGAVSEETPVKVIFDTDMGNDIDDALALDMLYKYADEGRITLLRITSNKEEHPASVEYIDILNTFYGYPDIPVGRIREGANCDRENSFVAQTSRDGDYKRTISDYDALPESAELLRRLLASQGDGEVTLIAVGFSTNLQRLMASGPDAVSSLDGMELIRRKVKHLYMMAGEFEQAEGKSAEYNIRIDRNAAQELFEKWPTPVTVSPFEVGSRILYPVESILGDFGYVEKHPLAEAYKVINRCLTTVQWGPVGRALRRGTRCRVFPLQRSGRIRVDDESMTWFEPDPAGRHRYLIAGEARCARARERMGRADYAAAASIPNQRWNKPKRY